MTEGLHYYTNAAGLFVMTEAAHHERGHCCGNRCLHCPYEFEAVVGYPEPVAPIEIRHARAADAPDLALLARQTFAGTYAKYQADLAHNLVPYLTASFAPDKVAASLAKADKHWWVAADQAGKLWGYAKLDDESRPGRPGSWHLQRLYVRRQAQGQGIGARLLTEVEAFAKTRDASAIWLTALKAERAAGDFYAPRGYGLVEEVTYTLGTQGFVLSLLEKCPTPPPP